MRIFTLLAFILFTITVNANHLLGGYMTYRYISGTTYEVTLTLYRDCNSTTPFDGTPASTTAATFGLFQTNSNILIDVLHITNPAIDTLGADTTKACTLPPSLCREIAIYTTNITLPSASQSYTIIYERCCLQSNLTNVYMPDEQGSVFWVTIPGLTINNSPSINIQLQQYAHLFDTLSITNWAQDTDGDSLSYSLMDPFSAASISYPAPDPPMGFPYTPVPWANTSYNVQNQLGNASLLSIDSITGTITALPRWSGIYIVGIKLSEWRSDTLLSEYPVLINLISTDCNNDTTYTDTTYVPTQPTAINEAGNKQINVFPNPATDIISITGLPNDVRNVVLTDLSGRELEQLLPSNGTCTFTDLQQYAKGIYIIKTGNMRRRIVIQ